MNVASLELSEQLYELSGWRNTFAFWHYKVELGSFDADEWIVVYKFNRPPGHQSQIPAYDLGFILRKLPNQKGLKFYDNEWEAFHDDYSSKGDISVFADTPENAVTKLAIELFQQGILTRKGEK